MNARIAWPGLLALIVVAGISAAELPDWTAKVDKSLIETASAQRRVDFLVAMNSRADLSLAEGARGREAKSALVMQVLKAHAANSQAGVLQLLASRGLPHRSFWIANTVSATGTLADVQLLAQRADVGHIYLVKPEIVDLPGGANAVGQAEGVNGYVNGIEEGNVRIKAPDVWALGFTGQGVVVGDHDIGVQWDHVALKKKYRGWDEATQTANHDYNWRNAFPADSYCPDAGVPCDSHGHGTHTTGTMVGDGGPTRRIGMAPDAKWIACRSLYDDVAGAGTVPTYMDCMEWMMAPYPIGDASRADVTKAPDVVNNSWGCLEACAPPVLQDVDEATHAAGILQVASAGNDGQGGNNDCSTIAFPLGVYASTFTVGASNTVNEGLASFTSKGPVASDGSLRIKPNVVAPGVGTQSSTIGNGTTYASLSGTSMASPHVAGMAALIMSAEPRLKGRVDDVRALIERTAFRGVNSTQTCGGVAPSTIPNNVFGYGRVDALAAVTARPQLTATLSAPGSAELDSTFAATLTISQPAAGKLDVTGAVASVNLPTGLELVSSSEASTSTSIEGGITTLNFARAGAMAPGANWTLTLQLKAVGDGDHGIAVTTEADQVSPKTHEGATVSVSGVVYDLTPDSFGFVTRTGVTNSVYVTSEARTITGIDAPVQVGVTNGQYRVNNGSWSSGNGVAVNGDSISVRHVSASGPGQTTTTILGVGTFETTFASVTSNIDRTPAAFGFVTQSGVELGTAIESNVTTPIEYNTAASVTAGPGASVRINGGGWVTSGTINPGETLQTKHTSSSSSLGYTKTWVKVGGVTGYFTTRTK